MSTDRWLLDDLIENHWEAIVAFSLDVNGTLSGAARGVKIDFWITKVVANRISNTLEMKPKPTGITVSLSVLVRFVYLEANVTLGF